MQLLGPALQCGQMVCSTQLAPVNEPMAHPEEAVGLPVQATVLLEGRRKRTAKDLLLLPLSISYLFPTLGSWCILPCEFLLLGLGLLEGEQQGGVRRFMTIIARIQGHQTSSAHLVPSRSSFPLLHTVLQIHLILLTSKKEMEGIHLNCRITLLAQQLTK